MKVTTDKKGLIVELPGREFHVLVDDEIVGSKHMTFGIAVVPEGSCLPWHNHVDSEEIIYVLKGTGTAESKTEAQAIEPGMVLYMEPGSEHQILNQGKDEMKLLCSFSPPVKIRAPK
ncbi:cupin domain-containing protein [Thermodesulfobacteriota bacterium]